MALDPNATIEEAIFSLLTSLSAITALVDSRVYPLKMPQNPIYPNIVYKQVSDRDLPLVNGNGGMYWPRFQFDCYARTYSQVKRLARTLRVQITDYSDTVGSIDICRIMFLNEVDDFDPVAEIYQIPVDFRIQYK